MAAEVVAVTATGVFVVNGPEDDPGSGPGIYIRWRDAEDNVARLGQRIFKAAQVGDSRKVGSLQKLLLRGLSNTLVSVRQVAQRNKGRVTAGIDGEVALTLPAVAKLATDVHRTRTSWRPLPVKRVYIPKARNKTKLRPLGIPVLMDRCHQARVRHALEPEWEARFEPRSYGFRPGRSCQDAREAIFNTLRGKTAKRLWILDADLESAFDQIDHDHLLERLGSFPARELVRNWLKAGVFEKGKGFAPTERGSPQGGVISPLLLNVVLHGLEEAAGVRYLTSGVDAGDVRRDSPVIIRYADDMLALCHTREQAEQVKTQLAAWLHPRGLAFNETKTRIVGASQGCDFLGYSIRRYSNGKLLIKPSAAAIRRVRERLAAEVRSLRGDNAVAVIARLNPIIRGWAAYYRGAVSGEVFNALDAYLWKLTYRWALRGHRNKSKWWVVGHHFGAFHPTRNDRWVFGDRASGAYLIKFSWTRIVRHRMVKGGASPYDPALADYWNTRHRKNPPPLGRSTLRLLQAQQGRCPLCGDYLLHADHQPASPAEWEQWLAATRKAITKRAIATTDGGLPNDQPTRLIHADCLRSHTRLQDNGPDPLRPAVLPSRLA
jgi:RNA-directed DNA polymerase